MKMVSMVALAAAMLLSAAPAEAQKSKKDKQEGPKLEMSEAFRKPAAAAQTAIEAKDWATADTQLAAAEAQVKNEDERFAAQQMRLTVEANKKNNAGIATALDALLANPRTAPANLPTYNFFRGQMAFKDKKYAEAIPFLVKARELGNKELEIPLYLAQSYDATNNRREGVAEMIKAIEASKAAGQKPEDSWYSWGVSRLYNLGDRSAAADLSMKQVREFPTVPNWRKVLVIFRDDLSRSGSALDRQQRLELFRLMRTTGALADEADYYDYARAAVDSALPWEAVDVIAEGKKAGKVPAGGTGFAEVETKAKAGVASEGSLDTQATAAAKTADGRATAGVADAYYASGNYARAVELYDAALAKGGVNVEQIQLRRGGALVRLGRKDEARTAFGLVKTAPLADIARFWLVSLDLPLTA